MLFYPDSKKIIILGINNLSLYLSKKLCKDYDIVLLDNKNDIINHEIDVIIDQYNENLVSSLKKHDIKNTDYFFSLTDKNEFNLFSAQLAKKMGAVKTASLITEDNYLLYNNNIDMLFNPFEIIINKISTMLNEKDIKILKCQLPGKINLSKIIIKAGEVFSCKKIKDINLKGGLIIFISRRNKVIFPEPDIELIPGDEVYIIHKSGMLKDIIRKLHIYKQKKALFIIGGNKLGLSIIRRWSSFYEPIIIVEPDLEICHKLAIQSDKILILNGEGTDINLLKEEGFDKSSTVLAISNNDLNNLLSGFCVKKEGCKNVITIINNENHKEIAKMLELKKFIIGPDTILNDMQHFLKDRKLNKYVFTRDVFASKYKANDSSTVLNKKIKDIKIKDGISIAYIIRDNKVIIPNGEMKILDNDELFIFYHKKNFNNLINIFGDIVE